jgi:hypothetical protein
MSVVDAGGGAAGGGYVYYQKLVVRPGVLNYRLLGVGLARIRAGAARAERVGGLLFGETEPQFGTAAWSTRSSPPIGDGGSS